MKVSYYMEQYDRWLQSTCLSEDERKELEDIQGDEKEIRERFFAPLEFGTAGLRGIMGMGVNRMNIYNVRQATQGMAELIKAAGNGGGAVVCYDCRNNSEIFAREAACVLAANGIHVRLFEALRPTPELSFAVIRYKAAAGINVTASHNPKEYNGYKVYWEDGAQLAPEKAAVVADYMSSIDVFEVKGMDYEKAVSEGLIELLGKETDEEFLKNALAQSIDGEAVKKAGMDIVYTPFHGAGHILVPEALYRLGVNNVICVPEQMQLDGNFPTVKSPNPENPEGFALAIELAKKKNVSLIIGTDPDSDRVGVIVRDPQGEYVPISGNQMGVMLLDYVIGARRRTGKMPENAAAVKSIVTTEMASAVAKANGIDIQETFTGFKFIAERVGEMQKKGKKVIFSYEESYGYMFGDFVRDKDAVTTSVMIAEMASYYALRGMTLYDARQELFEKYGYFTENTINLMMPGVDGAERMTELMKKLRDEPLSNVAGTKISAVRDYLTGTYSKGGEESKLKIKDSNVLYYELEDGTSFIIRPSGTEPKIKIYIMVQAESREKSLAKCEQYVNFAENMDKMLSE